jgi:hypothetical protein
MLVILELLWGLLGSCWAAWMGLSAGHAIVLPYGFGFDVLAFIGGVVVG